MKSKLEYYSVEISYGAQWIDLNDYARFSVAGDALATRAKTYRQIKTSSPITEGDVLIHAVADMVSENLKIWVYGPDQVQLEENIELLDVLFGQFSYQIRVTKNEHRETWTCQMTPNIVTEAGQVYSHNMMAAVTVTVPRQPTIKRERVSL